MSRTVKDYMDFILDVKRNIPAQTEGIIRKNESRILDLNRIDQLYEHGEDSIGLELQHYSPFTVQIKEMLHQPTDRTTLFYSGDFYKSFSLKFDKNTLTLTIEASDKKVPKLFVKYGANILGLSKENQDVFNYEILKPELINYIKQWL